MYTTTAPTYRFLTTRWEATCMFTITPPRPKLSTTRLRDDSTVITTPRLLAVPMYEVSILTASDTEFLSRCSTTARIEIGVTASPPLPSYRIRGCSPPLLPVLTESPTDFCDGNSIDGDLHVHNNRAHI